jgi:hypothetical protein
MYLESQVDTSVVIVKDPIFGIAKDVLCVL